jgi:hypothetical protein
MTAKAMTTGFSSRVSLMSGHQKEDWCLKAWLKPALDELVAAEA